MLTKSLNLETNITKLFIILSVLWSLSFLLSYFIYGPTPITDHITPLLGVSLAILVAILLPTTGAILPFELFIILCFLLNIHFFPRILQYLTHKQESLKLLYLLFPPNTKMINHGLFYIILGVILISLGLYTGKYLYNLYLFRSVPESTETTHDHPWLRLPCLITLTIAGVIVYSIDGYYTIFLGLSAAAKCDIVAIPGKWLIHFFSGDIYILVVLALLVPRYGKSNKSEKLFLFMSIAIYLFYTVLLGSRGGMLRLVTILFCIGVANLGSFKIRLSSVFLGFSLLFLLSAILFNITSVIREHNLLQCGKTLFDKSIKKEKLLKSEQSIALPDNMLTNRSSPLNEGKILMPKRLAPILDRLGVIDYPLGILYCESDQAAARKYLNMKYVGKNLANNLVIGTPFPEAQIMTSNLMPIIFRGFDMNHVEENFLSEPWTLWGLGYIYFGYFGGLVFIFVSSAVLQIVYSIGTLHAGKLGLSTVFQCFMLWLVAIGAFYLNMGFDHAVIVIIYGMLQLATILLIIFLSEKALNRYRVIS